MNNISTCTVQSSPSTWTIGWVNRLPVGSTVLDWACGNGRNAIALHLQGYEVLGIDRSEQALTELSVRGIETICHDLEHGPIWQSNRKFDAVIVNNYLHRARSFQLCEYLHSASIFVYETFMLGHEVYGRPTNPDFLLQAGELLQFAANARLQIVAFEQGLIKPRFEPHQAASETALQANLGGVPRLVQRLCAVGPDRRWPELRDTVFCSA